MHRDMHALASAITGLGLLLLVGCSTPEKRLYQWGNYQTQVNEYFKDASKEQQLQVLEADLEKIKSTNAAVPPGYHAQLGLLYSNMGKDDQMMSEFETEKALFPESAVYMDFLMKNAKGGAQK